MHLKPTRICPYLLHMAAPFLVASVICIVIVTDAHAYVDPGSGALIWQALLAALFGASFYSRTIIRRIKEWFNGRKQSSKEAK